MINKIHYIIAVCFASIITLSLLFYTIHFKNNSGAYTLMKLSMAIEENNNEKMHQLCDVKAFTENFITDISPLFINNNFMDADTAFNNNLMGLYKQNKPEACITLIYRFLQNSNLLKINYIERRLKNDSYLKQHYKIIGTDLILTVDYVFRKQDKMLKLIGINASWY